MKASYLIIAGLGIAALASCTGNKGWGVKGNIANAPEGTKLAIEANNAGHWYLIDSVEVSGSGAFEYNAEAPYAGTDILRITMPGKGSIYFPIDSVDHVSVAADAATFGTGHTLSGSALAPAIARVDSIVAATADDDDLRRQLIAVITSDTTGIVAYYTLGKSRGGNLIFNPKDNLGNRVYGAVAQLYETRYPADKRNAALQKAYFEGRNALGKLQLGEQQVYEVPETGFFEINRYDARGKECSLTELAKGKTVVLNFTTYEHQASPALNAILNDVYTKYHNQGLEIYQIAFDSDEVSWREAARNLPWTAVWNAPSDGTTVLMNYNIGSLPTTFIINKQGTLLERVENPADIAKEVAKHI